MAVPAVSTTTNVFASLPRASVFVANQLGRSWQAIDFLYCDKLKMVASPEIDEAELFYQYGPIIREPRGDAADPAYPAGQLAQYPPLDLLGMYCKIMIPGVANDGGDVIWYGVIEVDERTPDGSDSNSITLTAAQAATAGSLDDQSEPRGKQRFVAYGLIRVLEATPVMSAVVNQANQTNQPITELTIGMALPFNSFRPGEYQDRGNRSTFPSAVEGQLDFAGDGEGTGTGLEAGANPDLPYIFSELPQRTRPWNAAQAAAYLLARMAPVRRLSKRRLQMDDHRRPRRPRRRGHAGLVRHHRPLRRPKSQRDSRRSDQPQTGRQLLCDLRRIRRQRKRHGRYRLGERRGATGTATLNVFSFNNTQLSFNDAGSFELTTIANPNQRSLIFEAAFDVEATVTNAISSQYDRVVALGEFKTSTFTVSLDPNENQIVPDWTAAEETLYKTAASGDADYGTLPLEQQRERNTRFRQLDQIRHVYRRFEINAAWDHTSNADDTPLPGLQFLVAPLYNPDGTPLNGGSYNQSTFAQGDAVWNKGLTILPRLPLKDRFDYGGDVIRDKIFDQTTITGESVDDIDGEPAFLRPLFFVKTLIDDGLQRWEHLERLSETAPFDGGRTWTANVTILPQRPAFEINVAGKPQHFIATTSFAGAEAFDEQHDPAAEFGVNYQDIRGTISIKLFDRVRQEAVVNTEAVPGRVQRILYIPVSDARLDYVAPFTIVGLLNSQLRYTTSAGFVRDDRPRLAAIARAAAEWYGRPRQTLQLKLKRVNEALKLGWLITDVGPNYQLAQVNTPVTSLEFDLVRGTTEFRTAHADVEFE